MSSNTLMVSISSNGIDGAGAIRPMDESSNSVGLNTLRALMDKRGDVDIVRLWNEAETQQTEVLRRDAAFVEIVRPLYRAFAYDVRNPIVASRLQIGILRELDAEALEERRTSLADTLGRQLEAMSTGISLLIDELAPNPKAPPVDVLAVIDRVRRLALPYAQNQSATVETRTRSAALYTSAPGRDVKRALLGYFARLLPHADPSNHIEIRVNQSAFETASVILLTAEGARCDG